MPTKAKTQAEELYTANEVAAMLRVTVRAVARWCEQGRFDRAFKVGAGDTSPWRIPVKSYEAFIAERKESAQTSSA